MAVGWYKTSEAIAKSDGLTRICLKTCTYRITFRASTYMITKNSGTIAYTMRPCIVSENIELDTDM
jgi:hypothetical protein